MSASTDLFDTVTLVLALAGLVASAVLLLAPPVAQEWKELLFVIAVLPAQVKVIGDFARRRLSGQA